MSRVHGVIRFGTHVYQSTVAELLNLLQLSLVKTDRFLKTDVIISLLKDGTSIFLITS